MHFLAVHVVVIFVWFLKWFWLAVFGLVIKSPSDAASKWGARAAAAQTAYTSGVANTQKDQAALAAAAEGNWASATAAAAATHKFAARVTKAGTAAWKAGVAAVGGQRYSQGVQTPTAQTKYTNGVTPIFAALASLSLPARGVKGTNEGRVTAVINAEMAAAKART